MNNNTRNPKRLRQVRLSSLNGGASVRLYKRKNRESWVVVLDLPPGIDLYPVLHCEGTEALCDARFDAAVSRAMSYLGESAVQVSSRDTDAPEVRP